MNANAGTRIHSQRMQLVFSTALVLWVSPCVAQSDERNRKPAADVITSVVEESAKLIKSKKFEEARQALERYTRSNPSAEDLGLALLLKGRCQIRSKDASIRREALLTWERLVIRFAKSNEAAEALNELADAYSAAKNSSKARDYRERLLREFPEHPVAVSVWFSQAEEMVSAGRHADALAILKRMEKNLTPEQRARMDLVEAMTTAGGTPARLVEEADRIFIRNPAEAAVLYQEYLKRSPTGSDSSRAKARLGFCWARAPDPKDRAKAEQLWREVATRGPPSDEWVIESRWYLVQMLAGQSGEWRKAVSELDEIIKVVRPGTFRHEQSLFTKAWLSWANQDWRGALAGFQELVKAYPSKGDHEPIRFYIEDATAKLR